MDYQSILKSVVLTEKSNNMVDTANKYTFIVNKTATKGQVKEAIEKLYGVTVTGINMLKMNGKVKRSVVQKRMQYKRPVFKKAIIKLAEKNSIKLFEESKK